MVRPISIMVFGFGFGFFCMEEPWRRTNERHGNVITSTMEGRIEVWREREGSAALGGHVFLLYHSSKAEDVVVMHPRGWLPGGVEYCRLLWRNICRKSRKIKHEYFHLVVHNVMLSLCCVDYDGSCLACRRELQRHHGNESQSCWKSGHIDATSARAARLAVCLLSAYLVPPSKPATATANARTTRHKAGVLRYALAPGEVIVVLLHRTVPAFFPFPFFFFFFFLRRVPPAKQSPSPHPGPPPGMVKS